MDTLETVYLICFFVGLGFSVLSALLSGVFSHGLGHGDVHHDLGGHADGQIHFPLLSPTTICMFVTSFGGTGIVLKKLGWPATAHVPVAALSGFVVAGLVFLFFEKLFRMTGASSLARESEIPGTEAQVTAPIPLHGVGEIAYTIGTSRFTAPARAEDGKEIGMQCVVRIARIVGNICYVKRLT